MTALQGELLFFSLRTYCTGVTKLRGMNLHKQVYSEINRLGGINPLSLSSPGVDMSVHESVSAASPVEEKHL